MALYMICDIYDVNQHCYNGFLSAISKYQGE